MKTNTTARHCRGSSSTAPTKSFSERGGRLMTRTEVADELGVKERMVIRLIANGELRPTPVGKLVRIHVDDLDAYIAKQRGEAI